ncbi:hypothetical protein ABT404_49655, partial [Streptomyces hyaluromycini]
MVTAAWSGLPPIQRALGTGGPVADAGFGGRLPTWQNPSFTATRSHAVLDGESSARLAGGGLAGTPGAGAGAMSGLERPVQALPLAGPTGAAGQAGQMGSTAGRRASVPVVPLRAVGGGSAGAAGSVGSARPAGSAGPAGAAGSAGSVAPAVQRVPLAG